MRALSTLILMAFAGVLGLGGSDQNASRVLEPGVLYRVGKPVDCAVGTAPPVGVVKVVRLSGAEGRIVTVACGGPPSNPRAIISYRSDRSQCFSIAEPDLGTVTGATCMHGEQPPRPNCAVVCITSAVGIDSENGQVFRRMAVSGIAAPKVAKIFIRILRGSKPRTVAMSALVNGGPNQKQFVVFGEVLTKCAASGLVRVEAENRRDERIGLATGPPAASPSCRVSASGL